MLSWFITILGRKKIPRHILTKGTPSWFFNKVLRLGRRLLPLFTRNVGREPCPSHVALWNPFITQFPGSIDERGIVEWNKTVRYITLRQKFSGQVADEDIEIAFFSELG